MEEHNESFSTFSDVVRKDLHLTLRLTLPQKYVNGTNKEAVISGFLSRPLETGQLQA